MTVLAARSAPSLRVFCLRAAAWIAALTVGWTLVSPWTSYPVGLAARWTLVEVAPAWVRRVDISPQTVQVSTNVEVLVPGSGGRKGEIIVEADPARYAYGLPLLLGLLLASGTTRVARRLVQGLILLLPFQTFSLCSQVLMQIVLSAQADRIALKISSWQLDAITYAFQLGVLVVPTLGPVLVWFAVDRSYLAATLLAASQRKQ